MEKNEFDTYEIDIKNLKKMVNIILDHIITDLKIETLKIEDDKDYYWDVQPDDIFEVKKTKPKIEIGRLSDDWDLLQGILRHPEQGVSLTLIHVAPLLRWMGEKIGQ